jgi:hypothetical protein
MKHLAVVLLFALAGAPALAQKTIVDGNVLDDSCRYERLRESGTKLFPDVDAIGKASFCIGYIRAVLDEIWMQQNFPDELGVKNVGRQKICMSADIKNEQALKVAIKYLQDNPAKLQFPASSVIRLSMEEAFPCKSP